MAKKKKPDGEIRAEEMVKEDVMAAPKKYVLKALMNVRKEPSLDAEILGTKAEGTIVNVLEIRGDWLHLAEGAYILYENGKFAKKAE